MTNWYTSDLHLNHKRLIDTNFRKFDDELDMNLHILDSINSVVKPEDNLYILGDLCMSNTENDKYVEDWLKEIDCKNIYVIKGNHDKVKTLERLKEHKVITNWHNSMIVDENAFEVQFRVALHHYPVIDYHSSREAVLCLHGHSHGMLKNSPSDLFDVGLDVWDFKPVTLEQILSKYYGHYHNPFLGWVAYNAKWKKQYEKFCEKADDLR